MKHYFVDTNVVLDYLAQRQPFWLKTTQLIQAGADGAAQLYVSSFSFSTVFYVMRKQVGLPATRQLVAKLAQLVAVAAVGPTEVRLAVAGPFADFEDGLQHYAAVALPAIEAIVTRNPRDFAASALPVLLPRQALSELAA